MTAKYIESVMVNNRFPINISFGIEGSNYRVPSIGAIIDTGCQLTKLSALNVSDGNAFEELCNADMERVKIGDRSGIILSRGVTDDKEQLKRVKDLAIREIETSRNVCFLHRFEKLVLAGYDIGSSFDVKVSYKQTSPTLIGMNILKDFDFHCGMSKLNGNYMFLGCLKKDINSEYLKALANHFGYTAI